MGKCVFCNNINELFENISIKLKFNIYLLWQILIYFSGPVIKILLTLCMLLV